MWKAAICWLIVLSLLIAGGKRKLHTLSLGREEQDLKEQFGSIICVRFIMKLQLVDSTVLEPSCVRLTLNGKRATCIAVMATASDSAAAGPAGCKDNQRH